MRKVQTRKPLIKKQGTRPSLLHPLPQLGYHPCYLNALLFSARESRKNPVTQMIHTCLFHAFAYNLAIPLRFKAAHVRGASHHHHLLCREPEIGRASCSERG